MQHSFSAPLVYLLSHTLISWLKELNSFFIRYSFIAECSMIVISAQDLNTNRIPYNLEKEERHMYPGELQRWVHYDKKITPCCRVCKFFKSTFWMKVGGGNMEEMHFSVVFSLYTVGWRICPFIQWFISEGVALSHFVLPQRKASI